VSVSNYSHRASQGLGFEKWEGLGNDFVLVAAEQASAVWGPAGPSPEQVRRLCDRRRGVGADGVLLVAGIAAGRPIMIVRNADGSRPEMCGNGLRCVVGLVAAARALSHGELEVDTDAGARRCSFTHGPERGLEVAIDMGSARLGPSTELRHEGRTIGFRRIELGNPHAVTFDPCSEVEIDRLGAELDATTAGGCNVEFCRVREAERALEVTVWERGVGRTLACGTGACAAAAVAVSSGRLGAGRALEVRLPGGALRIDVTLPGLELRLEGPARRVFRGELAPCFGGVAASRPPPGVVQR
jgi:diaminopimelate epimerase